MGYAKRPTIHLHRVEARGDRTLGRLAVYGAEGALRFDGWALEPPWKENRRGVSCIPCGLYSLAWRTSGKYGRHLIVQATSPRELILIHSGNYPRHTRGCILPGMRKADLDGDGQPDVASSRAALRRVLAAVPEAAAGKPVARLFITSV